MEFEYAGLGWGGIDSKSGPKPHHGAAFSPWPGSVLSLDHKNADNTFPTCSVPLSGDMAVDASHVVTL